MKAIDILKEAERIEKTLIVLRKPTSNKYGYAVRICGDPMIEIMKIDWGTYGDTYTIKDSVRKRKVCVEDKVQVPIGLLDKLVAALIDIRRETPVNDIE